MAHDKATALRGPVRAAIRRRRLDAQGLVSGDLRLEAGGALSYRGAWTQLPSKQFKCFYLLVERSPRGVRREELARALFGPARLKDEAKALDKLVSRLRASLPRELGARLHAVRGFGWVYQPGS